MIIEDIDRRLKEIYEKHSGSNEDKTGFDFIQDLKKEAKNNIFLFYFFVYRTFEIALENKKIISFPNMIKELLRSPYHSEQLVYKERGKATNEEIEIFPGIIFTKGITLKVLEILKLEKTKKAFLYHLITKEKEINSSIYLSKKQIADFIDIEKVIDIFLDEYKELKVKKE